MLTACNLTKTFGAVTAVSNISFEIEAGHILGLIGPNGAGKSTVLGMIGGLLAPNSGAVKLDQHDVTQLPLHKRIHRGIGILRQHSSPLETYTVRENLALAEYAGHKANIRAAKSIGEVMAQTGLSEKEGLLPSELSHGDLRRLEFARILLLNPRYLLLDEPYAGLAEQEIKEFNVIIEKVRESGAGIVIVDHNIKAVQGMASRVLLMSLGQRVIEDSAEVVFKSEVFRDIYLGKVPTNRSDCDGELNRGLLKDDGEVREVALRVSKLGVRYGNSLAVRDVSFAVNKGEIVGIVGINGAGKSSICNAILGLVPSDGRIEYYGEAMGNIATWRRVRKGLGYVAEGRELFEDMTVAEHLLLVAGEDKAQFRHQLGFVFSLFPKLKERQKQRAGTLSGGEKQMLAIARSILRRPKVFILDEPTLGLAAGIIQDVSESLREIARMGMTIILAEQNFQFTAKIANRYLFLDQGIIKSRGDAGEMLSDAEILATMGN